MIRMIFSTVRAPHEPALTVESLAIRHDRAAVDRRGAGDDAVGGQPVGQRRWRTGRPRRTTPGRRAADPFAGEELAPRGVRLVVFGRTALLDGRAQLGDGGWCGMGLCVPASTPRACQTNGLLVRAAVPRAELDAADPDADDRAQSQAGIVQRGQPGARPGPQHLARARCGRRCPPPRPPPRSSLRGRCPVTTPMSSTMWTSSSVATLPVAPGAYGQPPRPPTRWRRSRRTPSSRAARTLASAGTPGVVEVQVQRGVREGPNGSRRPAPAPAAASPSRWCRRTRPSRPRRRCARPATDDHPAHRHVALVRAAPGGRHDHLHGRAAVVRDRR